MDDLLPELDSARYRPGGWAKASTLIAAAGWLVQLFYAARVKDIEVGACGNVIVPFLLAAIPYAVGSLCWSYGGRSRKAGDVAFAVIMIVEGVALAAYGLAIRR